MLSSNPSHNNNYIVAAIHNNSYGLAFFRHGNQRWKEIKNVNNFSMFPKMYFDVVFSNNFLYVLGESGSIDIWDFNQDYSSFPKSIQPFGPLKFSKSKKYYPVELFFNTLYLI